MNNIYLLLLLLLYVRVANPNEILFSVKNS